MSSALFFFSPQEELCDLPARVLKQGLDVLEIETVEQM
jgi:arginyl-tRNA synthetase